MRKIAIVGSCVSRDVFRICESQDFQVSYYAMHTCVPAQMSEPSVLPDSADLSRLSPFYTRNLRRDFNKELFTELRLAEFDAILIDFIEERYNIYVRGTETLSESYALEVSGLEPFCQDRFGHVVRLDAELGRFDNQFRLFAKRLQEVATGRPIFLNACHFASEYVSRTALLDYEPTSVRRHNDMLDHYYNLVLHDSSFVLIDSRKRRFRGSATHTWGVFPFHYEDAAYQFVIDHLRAHFGSVGASNVMSHEEYRFSDRFDEYQQAWLAVRQLFVEGRHSDCLDLVDSTRKCRKLSADECHYYGRALMKTPGRAGEAIFYLQAAVRHRASEPVWVHLSLAQVLKEAGRGSEALFELLEGVKSSNKDAAYANEQLFSELSRMVSNPQLSQEHRKELSAGISQLWLLR